MRQICLIASLALLLSCGQTPKKAPATDSIPPTAAAPSTASAAPAHPDSPHADSASKSPPPDTTAVTTAVAGASATTVSDTTAGIANWKDFWPKMKTAIVAKDTAAIIRLTYFPFFINSSLRSQSDFKESTIDQVFNIRLKKAGDPQFEGNHHFGGRDDDTNASADLSSDSTFFLYEPHKVYPLGRVVHFVSTYI